MTKQCLQRKSSILSLRYADPADGPAIDPVQLGVVSPTSHVEAVPGHILQVHVVVDLVLLVHPHEGRAQVYHGRSRGFGQRVK